ncbi:hypothetical protein B0H17DRAFT_1147992 [Mycena rosella]|uniref:Uncharacterized protein n=1 Tax=Mycena rosella TaxID=1033263 RepID=A0AAD7G0Z5_MYCRO|nr:hypothetical protein B0H17DRAFT_1147992 [Mycena rosella]
MADLRFSQVSITKFIFQLGLFKFFVTGRGPLSTCQCAALNIISPLTAGPDTPGLDLEFTLPVGYLDHSRAKPTEQTLAGDTYYIFVSWNHVLASADPSSPFFTKRSNCPIPWHENAPAQHRDPAARLSHDQYLIKIKYWLKRVCESTPGAPNSRAGLRTSIIPDLRPITDIIANGPEAERPMFVFHTESKLRWAYE